MTDPRLVKLEDAGIYEFITRDTAYVVDGIESDPYQLLLDMDTREIVGVQWPVAPDLAPLVRELVAAIDDAVTFIGEEYGDPGDAQPVYVRLCGALVRAAEAGFESGGDDA